MIRTWCAVHQLDLVVKTQSQRLFDGEWLKVTYTLSVYLRKQQNLITEMGGLKCPKKTTRWVAMGSTIEFLLKHRIRIMNYINAREGAAAPPAATSQWWIITYAIAPAIDAINFIIVTLQDQSLLIHQQREHLVNLSSTLALMFDAKLMSEDDSFTDMDMVDYFVAGLWWISKLSIIGLIKNQGSFARNSFEAMDVSEQACVVEMIAQFAMSMITGIMKVKAERDYVNAASEFDSPPVMPYQIVKLLPRHFISTVLDPYREQISLFWEEADVEQIERDQSDLYKAFTYEPTTTSIINSQDHTTPFNDGWDAVGKGRFAKLRQFMGGLAVAFANKTSVEADFSILK